MEWKIRGVVCLVALFVPATAGAQAETDAQIKAVIEHTLEDKDIGNVQVKVRSGVVSLAGTVPHVWAKKKALDLAMEHEDVKEVLHELEIARGESDTTVAEEVARRVRRYVFYTIYDDVQIAVQEGVVTLGGRVTMGHKSSAVGDMASRVLGVQEVNNEIRTLPASAFDDDLRRRIAAHIYGDTLFFRYGFQVDPPIHIIVENSRVTITGVVGSEVERRKAGIIARSTFGVLGVENKLRIE